MDAIPEGKRVRKWMSAIGAEYHVPVRVATSEAKAEGSANVEPETLPELAGDRSDGHIDAECGVERLGDVVEDGVDDDEPGKCRAALCLVRSPDANIDVTRHMSGVTPLSVPAPSLLSSFPCDTPNARSCPKLSPSAPLLPLQVFNPILYPNRTICPIGPQILAEIPRDLSWMTHQVQEDGALPSASVIRVRSRT